MSEPMPCERDWVFASRICATFDEPVKRDRGQRRTYSEWLISKYVSSGLDFEEFRRMVAAFRRVLG